MASYRDRDRGGGSSLQSGARPHPSRPRDDFYDERRSRSGSPERSRISPYDNVHQPSGLAPGQPYSRDDRERSPRGYKDMSRDRRGQYTQRHSSPPRGRSNYSGKDYSLPEEQQRSRSRSYSPRDARPSSRGRSSKEIMMDGLALHLTAKDVQNELENHYNVHQLEDVRVIRDRQTKQSRGFGFLRFPTVEDAEVFMDANYPTVYIYGEGNQSHDSDEAKVRISYSRERKDAERPSETDWVCKLCNVSNFSTRLRCFRCQSLRPETGPSKTANIGDNDASTDNVPSQFLLLRGLELSVTEELLAKGVAKLNKPAAAAFDSKQAMVKKGKVASTTGDSNLGARDGSLRRILLVRDRRTNESWRYGFAEYASIEDAQAALTRYNSFERFTIASKHVLVSYIHAGVFVPILNPTPATERFTFSPLGNPALKLAYWDEEAYIAELIMSTPETETKGIATQADNEGSKTARDAEKAKKRKAPADTQATLTKKTTPSHLQFWSNRHAELHGIQHKSDASGSEISTGAMTPSRSFADPQRNCCYLCMRQFISVAEVNRHERMSDLHRKNLKDELKVKRAEHKLEKHNVRAQQTAAGIDYRDRARERRKVYGVVNKKGEQVGSTPKVVKQAFEDEPAQPVQSKGASLLSKMGYTAGQGLGASGEGMTAPISQDIYVAGVGLGAQGGKVGDAVAEAERNTKADYGAFAEQTRDKARERYSRM